jgi:hypothetical protein
MRYSNVASSFDLLLTEFSVAGKPPVARSRYQSAASR